MNMGSTPITEYSLILNSASPLIGKLAEINTDDRSKAELIAKDIYKLSVISQRHMSADELKEFLCDSYKILEML